MGWLVQNQETKRWRKICYCFLVSICYFTVGALSNNPLSQRPKFNRRFLSLFNKSRKMGVVVTLESLSEEMRVGGGFLYLSPSHFFM